MKDFFLVRFFFPRLIAKISLNFFQCSFTFFSATLAYDVTHNLCHGNVSSTVYSFSLFLILDTKYVLRNQIHFFF